MSGFRLVRGGRAERKAGPEFAAYLREYEASLTEESEAEARRERDEGRLAWLALISAVVLWVLA